MAAAKDLDRWVCIRSGHVANREAILQKPMMPWLNRHPSPITHLPLPEIRP